jgi:uncharacterized protein
MITAFYAGLLALILLALSIRVVMLRRRHQVGIGTGEHRGLELAVRAQANFCEYVPIALILLLVLELTGSVAASVLHVLGLMLVTGRLLHGFFGLNRSPGTSMGRFVGTLLTWLTMAATALFVIGLATGHWLANP